MADLCGIEKDLAASKKLEDKATKHLAGAKESGGAEFVKNALHNLEGYRTQATKESVLGRCEVARSLLTYADGVASEAFKLPKKSIVERLWNFCRDHLAR